MHAHLLLLFYIVGRNMKFSVRSQIFLTLKTNLIGLNMERIGTKIYMTFSQLKIAHYKTKLDLYTIVWHDSCLKHLTYFFIN